MHLILMRNPEWEMACRIKRFRRAIIFLIKEIKETISTLWLKELFQYYVLNNKGKHRRKSANTKSATTSVNWHLFTIFQDKVLRSLLMM